MKRLGKVSRLNHRCKPYPLRVIIGCSLWIAVGLARILVTLIGPYL
ncbi:MULTISPECIES: hypothetical protein [unclassified Siphonobacter]|nr:MULTISPECIES: hypothetical protein [unclassified Siphonobacter]